MNTGSIGFIGGGRVARIVLGGLRHAGAMPSACVVSDPDAGVIEGLQSQFPEIRATGVDTAEAARQDLVFGALHPPAMKGLLPEIGEHLRPESVFISLALVIQLPALRAGLDGFDRVARMIPNAASVVGSGFNPIALSDALDLQERRELLEWLGALGECPQVPEGQLEAFAILTAMGPTYFWYQFDELQQIGEGFGLDPETTRHALKQMLYGSVRTFFGSGIPAAEVIDLVPVKPMQDHEGEMRNAYRSRLRSLHDKLTQR